MKNQYLKSNKLLIVGAGSFSTEVEELACLLGYTDISFLDDNPDGARSNPVIGCFADIKVLRQEFDTAIVALGNNENRLNYHKLLKEYEYNIPFLIHPTAFVSSDANISPGCIIRSNAVISRYVSLGEAVIVNVGALIDHDCSIGKGSHLLMGCVVRNEVSVAPLSWIKSNSVIE